MLLFDVNIYIHAHREDSPHHKECKTFLEKQLEGTSPVGYAPLALSGFLRIVTHPKVFNPPTDMDSAIAFCDSITELPNTVSVRCGESHWDIFTHFLRVYGSKGNLVPDTWFAALAISQGCTWVTTDRDYSRFETLKVLYPFTS